MRTKMLRDALFVILVSATIHPLGLHGQTNLPPLPSYLAANYDETGRPLPPGVPKDVDTNGKTVYVPHRFTTAAYQDAAFNMVLWEANRAAKEMRLPEKLPFTKSDLIEYHISPFGFAYARKMIGSVTTKNYVYYVASGDKLNEVGVANYDQTCLELQKKARMPISRIDTNVAYQLATQWLASASMDVAGLNRGCKAHVGLSPFWNGVAKLGDMPKRKFVPIYFVWWSSPQDDVQHGDTACVELYLPTKKLLQMTVSDPKYILRKPLVFTNLAALFPGVAPIHTNYPVETIYMPAPPP